MSEELTNRLFNYAAAPPPGNWEAIATAIDNQMSVTARTLEAYQKPAPPQLWDKIALALQEEQPATGLNLKKQWSLPVRTISAAAILLLVATLITLYVNRSEPSRQVARQPSGAAPAGTALVPDSGAEERAEETLELPEKPWSGRVAEAAPLAVSKGNRYMVMAQDDGQTVRLSKKAFTVFECAENSAPHNKERCKENIELMQQKMAASMLSPAGDFGGLIDMIKSLEEND